MESRLSKKRILLICPKFFNYHKEIIYALEQMGAYVDYFDERPSNTAVGKALLRINKRLIEHKIVSYYKTIVETISKNEYRYDYILIVKAEAIPKDVINRLRELNPGSKIIIELWDSISNNSQAAEKIDLVDKVFSFDRSDCLRYNMKFRPLFYINKYNKISKLNAKTQYDLLFVGTVHSDRYKILKNMEKKLLEKGYKVYYYMYIPSKILYYVRKYILRQFPGSSKEDFKFKPIGQDEVLSLVSKSKVILDIQHPNQTGLTMRTVEMLGANKKIITTNSDIKSYDFYCRTNIQVVDRKISNFDMNFFESEYVAVKDEIKQAYSLESWLLELLY